MVCQSQKFRTSPVPEPIFSPSRAVIVDTWQVAAGGDAEDTNRHVPDMGTMTTGGEQFRSILENRNDVLRRLVDGPTTKADLVESLDTSRSTVDRAIRDLQTVECISRTNGGFVATTTGRLALAEYDRYAARTDAIRESHGFLDVLPTDAPLDTAMLHGATITLPDQHAPEEALQPAIDVLDEATSLRGTAPVVLSFYPDLFERRVRENGLSVEVVAEDEVLAVLPTMMSDRVEPFINHEQVSLFRSAGTLPYALWLMETPDGTYAGITAYDAGGLAGLLINDSPAAVEWAEHQYEQYRADAAHVPSSRM